MDVTMLLCDAADEQNGKLYILGGGWSAIRAPNIPVPMALAVKMAVPWDQSNRSIKLRAALLDDDGTEVDAGAGPVVVDGELEVGRLAGMKPGQPIDAPFVLKFGMLVLPAGGYVWELSVDGTVMARAPFRVQEG